MNDWTLLIDLGTSFTKAAIADADGRIEPIDPSGGFVTPSGIWSGPDGTLMVEPAAEMLRRVAAEAGRRRRGKPGEVRLTCSARWEPARRDALLEAVRLAGLGARSVPAPPQLVDYPVAAALQLARAGRFDVGTRIALLGLGAGSAETAVLESTPDGVLIRALGGIEGVGGEQFDELLYRQMVGHAMTGWDTQHARRLWEPSDDQWRRAAAELFGEVRRAKEELSEQRYVDLETGPLIDTPLELSRIELEAVLRPLILRTARELATTIELAGLRARQLDGILLTGGSSRMPLVARVIFDVTGVHPEVLAEPNLFHGAAARTPRTRVRPESTPVTVAGRQTGEEAAAAAAAAAAALAATGAIDLLAIGAAAQPTLPQEAKTSVGQGKPRLPRMPTGPEPSTGRAGLSRYRRWLVIIGVAVVLVVVVGLVLNGSASGDDDGGRSPDPNRSLPIGAAPSAAGTPGAALPAVTGLSASTRGISVDLVWDAVPGATAYTVYRDAGTADQTSRTVTRTTLTDRPGDAAEHRYSVVAVDDADLLGPREAEVAARAAAPYGEVQNIASAWPAVVPVRPGAKGSAGQTCKGTATDAEHATGRITCTFRDGVRLVIMSYDSPADRDLRAEELAARPRVSDAGWKARKPGGGALVTGRMLAVNPKGKAAAWRWWSYDSAPGYAISAVWPKHSAKELGSWWRQRAPFST